MASASGSARGSNRKDPSITRSRSAAGLGTTRPEGNRPQALQRLARSRRLAASIASLELKKKRKKKKKTATRGVCRAGAAGRASAAAGTRAGAADGQAGGPGRTWSGRAAAAAEGAAVRRSARRRVRPPGPRLLAAPRRPALALRARRAGLAGAELGAGRGAG